jgi:hypothetical protein
MLASRRLFLLTLSLGQASGTCHDFHAVLRGTLGVGGNDREIDNYDKRANDAIAG